MSLIGDAMREAQRVQNQQARVTTTPLGTVLVPRAMQNKRRTRLFAFVGILATTSGSLVAGTLFALHKEENKPLQTRTRPVLIPPVTSIHDSVPIVHLPIPAIVSAPKQPAPLAKTSQAVTASATVQRVTMASGAPLKGTLYKKQASVFNSRTLNDSGIALAQRGEHGAAGELFRQALSQDSANAETWINLGDLFDATGRHADATNAYSRAINLDPSQISVKTRLAKQYQVIGDLTAARKLFAVAAEEAPNDPMVHYSFAVFHQSQREYSEAIREYQRFVELAPERYSATMIAEVQRHIEVLKNFAP